MGNARYRLRGRDFVSFDDRFAYVFAPYAGSAFPRHSAFRGCDSWSKGRYLAALRKHLEKIGYAR